MRDFGRRDQQFNTDGSKQYDSDDKDSLGRHRPISSAGWVRNVRTQELGWHKGGIPKFGQPASSDAPIRLPAGEPGHQRYEAEDQVLTGTAKVLVCDSASNEGKVGYVDTPKSHVEFRVFTRALGKYNRCVRFGNGTNKNEVASHKLSVNGKSLPDQNSGWDRWSNVGAKVEFYGLATL